MTDRRGLSRREFLGRAATLGVSAGAVGAWLSACGAGATPTAPAEPTGKLTIAYQPGIGYAQLIIAKQNKWLEEQLPKLEIAYRVLSSGAAIRDGMLANEIQVGSGGAGPFLVGWDAGVGWKLLSSLNEMDLWLMVKDDRIKGLKDLKPGDKVAMPAADSIQAVVLRKAAQKELGNAHALDVNIVALSHPDGLQQLTSGQIAGHLTSPPFQFQEQDGGARRLLGSYDLFGQSTFNSVYVRQAYHDANPKVMDVLYKTIQRATELIKSDPDKAAQIVATDAGGNANPAQYKGWMTAQGVTYSTVPKAYVAFAQFMKEIDLIKKTPASWQDLVYDNLKQEQGS